MVEKYWWNVRTSRVETGDDLSPDRDRLGPYPTEEAARRALDSAHERTARLDAEDEEWENG